MIFRPSPKHKELQLPDIEYIDTYQKYNIKIKARERQEYWSFLINSKRKVKEPEGRETDEEVVERTFPPLIGYVFSLVVGQIWDYLYLLLFLIFIILVSLRHDGYLPVFIHSYLSTIYTALLVVMFVAQVIPIIGTSYFITHYNLRTHFRASTEFAQVSHVRIFESTYMIVLCNPLPPSFPSFLPSFLPSTLIHSNLTLSHIVTVTSGDSMPLWWLNV